MASDNPFSPECYRIASAAIDGGGGGIRLDTSYHEFMKRHGLTVRTFRITQPDGTILFVRASPAILNTPDPHKAKPLLFLQQPLPTTEIASGSYLSVHYDSFDAA